MSGKSINYYAVLNVPQNASKREITKAYRTKALELHPDKNNSPDAHEKFIELKQAYDLLSAWSKIFKF